MLDIVSTPKVATELTIGSLQSLLRGEIVAIVLNNVISPAECERACRKVRALTERSTYLWSSDLTVLGTSIGEAHENDEARERYFSGAESTMRIAREVVFDGATPVDMIVQKMLAVWPHGMCIPFADERPFLAQILRRWKSGGGAHPHIDQSRTPLLSSFEIERRIGLNVYMEMPTVGGAVEFWSRCFTDEEYIALKRPDYGLKRDLLGEPAVALRPRPGQAILFDAFKPHAVEAVAGEGERITNATFFGYAGPDRPMFLFA